MIGLIISLFIVLLYIVVGVLVIAGGVWLALSLARRRGTS